MWYCTLDMEDEVAAFSANHQKNWEKTCAGKIGLQAFPLLTTHRPDQRHVCLEEEHAREAADDRTGLDLSRSYACPTLRLCSATATASGQPNRCRSSALSRGPLASALRSSGAQSKSALLARVANGKAESTSTQTMTSPKPERIHPSKPHGTV